MARNKLIDLNDNLFEALERLNDEELSDEDLDREIKRSKAMTDVGKVIVDNARLVLEAQKHYDGGGNKPNKILCITTGEEDE